MVNGTIDHLKVGVERMKLLESSSWFYKGFMAGVRWVSHEPEPNGIGEAVEGRQGRRLFVVKYVKP